MKPLIPLLACTLAGCQLYERADGASPDAAQGSPPGSWGAPPAVDVLFVIGNSASAMDIQTMFAHSLASFIDTLDEDSLSGRPDLHIGVVDTTVDIASSETWGGCPTPDPTDDGTLQNAPRVAGCGTPSDHYIVDVADGSGRDTNYPSAETLADALACIAPVGATGCMFDEPLEAMKRALDGSRPENAGFLRADAVLAVVIVADKDDASAIGPTVFDLPDSEVGGHDDFRVHPLLAYQCDTPISATVAGTYEHCAPRTDATYLQPVSTYTRFLATIKDPARTVVAVIAGPPTPTIETGGLVVGSTTQPLTLEPSCKVVVNGEVVNGWPALRLARFASSFADRGAMFSICQSDYSSTLETIAQTITATADATL